MFFLGRGLFIPKKLIHIVRDKLKKGSWQLVKKQRSYSKKKKVNKMPKKLNIFRLKIHKGAGTLKKPKTFLNKGTEHEKNHMEGLSSKNKNIKDGGSP